MQRIIRLEAGRMKLLLGFAIGFGAYFSMSVWHLESFPEGLVSGIFMNAQPREWTTVFISVIPTLVFVIATAGSFSEDLEISCTYIFPRLGSPRKWLFQKSLLLFVQAVFYWTVSFILTAMVFTIKKRALAFSEVFSIPVAIVFTMVALFALFGAMLVNVMSLIISGKWAILVYTALITLSLITSNVIFDSKILLHINPVANYYIPWHQPPKAITPFYVPSFESSCHFSILSSYVYFGLVLCFITLFAMVIINNKDLYIKKAGVT